MYSRKILFKHSFKNKFKSKAYFCPVCTARFSWT